MTDLARRVEEALSTSYSWNFTDQQALIRDLWADHQRLEVGTISRDAVVRYERQRREAAEARVTRLEEALKIVVECGTDDLVDVAAAALRPEEPRG